MILIKSEGETYISRRFSPQLTSEGAELKLPPLLMSPGSGSSEFSSSLKCGTHLVPSKSVIGVELTARDWKGCEGVKEYFLGIVFLQLAHGIIIGSVTLSTLRWEGKGGNDTDICNSIHHLC